MKVELLSPVGNREMLYQAIHNGADAVYLSGELYGARKFAKNFTREELKEAVEYSHLYGVLVYVTVNTIIYENEAEDVLTYVEYLYKIGVDALIMQDVGMMDLIHQRIPVFPIHASTQLHNYSKESIPLLKDLGVSRVVFARETNINDLKGIKDIETEVFIHGALCISYSGCCLFSSLVGGRSGNRGECAGSCRLKYDLIKDNKEVPKEGKYLLSAKELCTIDNIEDILSSNITSLKIEGRMKSPEYVGFVTRLYRRIIDSYYEGKTYTITDQDRKSLMVLYNREFTKGFINGENPNNITNIKSPKHIGINLGKATIEGEWIKIELEEPIHQGDGIRFEENNKGLICNYLYNDKKELVSNADNIVYIKNTNLITKACSVLKTFDKELKDSFDHIEEKKIEISFSGTITVNKPLIFTISDNINTITKEFDIVEQAKTNPTTKEEVIEKLSQLGNTPFVCKNIDLNIDNNSFIPMKVIKDIRRTLVEELINKRQVTNRKLVLSNYKNSSTKEDTSKQISFLVRTKEQLDTCIEEQIDRIYIDDKSLYEEYKTNYKNIYYYEPRVSKLENKNNENLVVSDLSTIEKYKDNNMLIGSCYLNVVNSYHIHYLSKYLNRVCLSIESDFDNTKQIVNNYKKGYNSLPNIEILIYGRVDLMIMKYDLINDYTSQYYLRDRKNMLYPIIKKDDLITILHYKNIDQRDMISDYKKIGINKFLCILYNESKEEIKKIIKSIIK